MAREEETAYPRLETTLGPRLLEGAFTPTESELTFVRKQERALLKRTGLLLHLKLFQRLGRFVDLKDVPTPVVRYVGGFITPRVQSLTEDLHAYDGSKARFRHMGLLREFLKVRPLDAAGSLWLKELAQETAWTKEAVTDIINVLLEELPRHAYEFPAFETLNRLARHARQSANEQIYRRLNDLLDDEQCRRINDLLRVDGESSPWQLLKSEPRKPTIKAVRAYLAQVAWRRHLVDALPALPDLPVVKRRQMLLEARALDVTEMRGLKSVKRYALALLFVHAQLGKAVDDAAEVLIRLVQEMNKTAIKRLEQHTLEHAAQADALIERFRSILYALQADGSRLKRFDAIEQNLGGEVEPLIESCEKHLAYAKGNYLPFLLDPYRRKRALLFECLGVMELRATNEDTSTLRAIKTLQALRHQRKDFLPASALDPGAIEALNALPRRWQKQVWTDGLIHRKFFEIAIFNLIRMELHSGDLALAQGVNFDDFREQLIDDEVLEDELDSYGQVVELPTDPKAFVHSLRERLTDTALKVDADIPRNADINIKDGRLTLRRPRAALRSQELEELDQWLVRRLPKTSIVDILVDTEKWLDLHQLVYPLSGHAPKIRDSRLRFIATLFCYGCNLGPAQTSQSIKGFTRRQIAWLNLKQITEDQLDKMITRVINAYNHYELPTYWGSGKHAAADGTKWDLYEENLISTYHIRYGGYGGIGYYHVSDKYIALFSHFIPCGVREAIYILDGLMANESDIQPEVLHGDSHAQTFPVFALAYLLGIELMPRMRDLNRQQLFRPSRDMRFSHIDSLFTESIDWDLIERHLPDMYRIAISIKTGHITASTILQRLGTFSRKNKVYFAFRELGRAVKTIFLLRYISDLGLRQSIHAETNKCEEFNAFAKWVFFGGEGIIAENVRHEQLKVTKYNHLVANLILLYNVEHMTRELTKLRAEGFELSEELLRGLAPYRTSAINRFGDYTLNVGKKVDPMDPNQTIFGEFD